MRQDAFALREVRVRTVRPDEEPRWNELMRERHYLGFRNFCGKRLRQVAVHGERWLALIGWHAAALHCAARDRWIALEFPAAPPAAVLGGQSVAFPAVERGR